MDHKNQHRWHLLFVLPNLVLKEPIECGFVALVPNQDSRLDEARVGASGKLLSSFENPFQKALQPTALITYQSAEERQPLDALLAFRNAVALAALIDEWTKAHRHPGNGGVLYSLTVSICTHLLLQMITLALLFPHLLLQERRFRIHSVDNVQQQFLTLFIFPFCSETVLS